MIYKALVLDIDGTLIYRGRREVTDAVTTALKALQQKGVVVILATGRAPFACVPEALGTDMKPDYRVCANGACILDAQDTPVYENRMDVEQIQALVDYAQQHDFQLNFTYEDNYYAYVGYEGFLRYYKNLIGSDSHLKDGTDGTRHLISLPYGAYTTMPPEAAREFCRQRSDLKMLESVPGSFDIARIEIDKAEGIGRVLQYEGIPWEQVVAVGDGENDIEMLERAGVGIAMGNAPPQVRAAADDVAPSIEEDGVLYVIEKYFS